MKDLTGQRFGRLYVVGPGEERKSGLHYVVRCDCGSEKQVKCYSLASGVTLSCGCLNKETNSKQFTKHGLSRSRQYQCWHGIINRCTLASHLAYKDYGGRGIKVCDKWLTFEGFWEDMEQGYADNLTINRRDNNGNYCKENCEWITSKENNRNTRRTVIIETPKGPMVFAAACELFGIPDSTLWNRINRAKLPKEKWFEGYE